MEKEDWQELHGNLLVITKYFLSEEELEPSMLEEYDELNIHPDHVEKSEEGHKEAVFVLGSLLAESMSDDEFSNAKRISRRLEELADDI